MSTNEAVDQTSSGQTSLLLSQGMYSTVLLTFELFNYCVMAPWDVSVIVNLWYSSI